MRGLLSQICYEIDMRPVTGREKAVENKLDLDMTADTQCLEHFFGMSANDETRKFDYRQVREQGNGGKICLIRPLHSRSCGYTRDGLQKCNHSRHLGIGQMAPSPRKDTQDCFSILRRLCKAVSLRDVRGR